MSQFCFPILKLNEIVSFFYEIDVHVTENDFRKPDPLKLRQIYGILLEHLTNINPDQVYQNCLVKSADVFEYPELHIESLPITALVLSFKRVMITCGIRDFTVQDIINPSLKRLVRICSGAINFYKFRDSRVGIFESYKQENQKYKELFDELRQMINKHKVVRAEQEPEIRKTQDEIEEFKGVMSNYHKQCANTQKDTQEIKTELAGHKADLDQLKVNIIEQEKSIEIISHKIIQSPEKIVKELERNQEKMMALKSEIDEKRNRKTEWSRQADKFKLRESTADKLLKILQSCEQEKEVDKTLKKEMAQNAEVYQELQTVLEQHTTKKSQLEAVLIAKQEAISKYGGQFAARKKALYEELEQCKSQKMLYAKKQNIESEQIEDILKQKLKVSDSLGEYHKEVDEKLDNISSLYSQLSERYQDTSFKIEDKLKIALKVKDC